MATAATLSYNVKDTSVSTTVPDDDVAHLMYYLNCITKGVGLDILQDDLIDYQRYYSLTPTRIAVVFKTAVELSPDELIGKLIFRDDEHDLVPNHMNNTFISISAACNVVSVSSNMIIAGKVQNVTEVMFFTSHWLDIHYTKPVERIARAVLGTKHCSHCQGDSGPCACTSCPRAPESNCQNIFDSFLEALIAPARTATPQPPPKPAQPTVASNAHYCNCDGCGWATFTGNRYKCTTCGDYDLCEPCYKRNVHDLSHPFMRIEKQGGKPVYLTARQSKPPPPPTPKVTPAPPPYTYTPPQPTTYTGMGRDGSDTPKAKKSDSPFFYTSMSISELRSFLRDHGVSADGILDKETLCKHVWETHCESMSMAEINKFLLDNKISTADCRDIASRRQKAKSAFVPPSRPAPPPSSTKPQANFKRDDNIVLKGLTRADMNGKSGVILSVDHAAGRVQVRVPALDKTFKVKFENLELEEEDEELE